MTVEDALRKITLLRKISSDKGAMPAERETAYRLQKVLMERYAITTPDIPETPPRMPFRLNWSYWQDLLEEFALRLDRLGNRGSVAVGNKRKLCIRLDKGQWWIEERSPRGRHTTARDHGVESLREYLKVHAPKSYSFQRR